MLDQIAHFTIFCDDLRVEASGKVILIGCYSDNYLLESLPGMVQKLTLHTTIRINFKPKESDESSVKFSTVLNNIELASVEIDLASINFIGEPPYEFKGLINLKPFQVESESVLETLIQIDDRDPVKGTPITFTTKELYQNRITNHDSGKTD